MAIQFLGEVASRPMVYEDAPWTMTVINAVPAGATVVIGTWEVYGPQPASGDAPVDVSDSKSNSYLFHGTVGAPPTSRPHVSPGMCIYSSRLTVALAPGDVITFTPIEFSSNTNEMSANAYAFKGVDNTMIDLIRAGWYTTAPDVGACTKLVQRSFETPHEWLPRMYNGFQDFPGQVAIFGIIGHTLPDETYPSLTFDHWKTSGWTTLASFSTDGTLADDTGHIAIGYRIETPTTFDPGGCWSDAVESYRTGIFLALSQSTQPGTVAFGPADSGARMRRPRNRR